LKFYADVHRTKRNDEGYRITYTTDGITFKHIDSFGEIPAGPGDKLFMDTLPPQHTDGAIELLRRGVEVYCLRRLTLLSKVREELKLPKTARGDIKALMSIEEKWFRRVTEDFLVMRRMILAHRSLMKTHQQLLNKYRALSEAEREVLKPAISSIEKQMLEMARQIAVEAGKRYPAYNVLVEALGVSDPSALEALAEVLLPEWRSWRRIRNFFGLWRRDRKTYFHRSKTARQALERLTISLKGHKIRGNDLKEVLKTIWINLKAQEAGPVPA
jgi:DNA-directed RNA polymerase subunit N (RpoN/RPB10)